MVSDMVSNIVSFFLFFEYFICSFITCNVHQIHRHNIYIYNSSHLTYIYIYMYTYIFIYMYTYVLQISHIKRLIADVKLFRITNVLCVDMYLISASG